METKEWYINIFTTQNSRVNCKAALFNNQKSTCILSMVSINDVNNPRKYFKHDKNFDLYENNCFKSDKERSLQCRFVRMHSSGLTDVFDEKLSGLSDEIKCEKECLNWKHGICQSYIYDKNLKECFLSHATSRSLGRNFITIDDNLSFGELDDCMELQLSCKADGFQLSGWSLKLFNGTFKIKKAKEKHCERFFKDTEPQTVYTAVVMLKEGSTDLITFRDKIIQANHLYKSIIHLPI
ncbi:unnamed protein product [Dracunculus medinensis]|uniref:Apple domain-containing protein n=1 Tax=Dracunculus medinensis TaxID=318479 RepID=A0A3P7PPB3_DRAME|nr:unnamed protein product [Dracunculus medinensis]